MRTPSSIDQAIERAGRVKLNSSFVEMATLLEYAGNAAIVPAMLHRRGLEPVRKWLAQGIQFVDIFLLVYRACISLDPYKIKSWHFFEASLKARDVQR